MQRIKHSHTEIHLSLHNCLCFNYLRQKQQTWVRSVQFPTASLQKVTGNNTTVIEIPISAHIQQEKIDILFVFFIFCQNSITRFYNNK